MCFIYAAFMFAVIRLRKRNPDAARSFRTPVVETVQWALTAVLLLMGAFTLFSDSSYRFRCAIGLLLSVVLAWMLTLRSGLGQTLKKQRDVS
jgi:ethanolamine permease